MWMGIYLLSHIDTFLDINEDCDEENYRNIVLNNNLLTFVYNNREQLGNESCFKFLIDNYQYQNNFTIFKKVDDLYTILS